MSFAPGERFGSYEVAEIIGVGGMGEVYRARDPRLERDVALKILPDANRLDREAMQRFEREARVLAALNHPNIATLHGIETDGGTQALVMELVDGDTLAERLEQRSKLALADVLHVARQIADALDAAHERGVVHRDLKPANVKIRPDGTVKVLDFGIAKVLDSGAGEKTGATLGIATPVESDGATPTFGPPQPLFTVDTAIVPHSTLTPNFHTYAVTPDGERFVFPLPVSTLRAGTASAAITVVLNWSASLGR